jgi:dimethylargininase
MDRCELTYVERTPIDHQRARKQHDAYCRLLRRCGAEVHTLDVNRDFPDAAFIEDTAVVLDEVAVLASMGIDSRRNEPAGIEPELRKYRPVHRIEPPATIEGGDVIRVSRTLLVGVSSRTNSSGVNALKEAGRRYDYEVIPVRVHGCLHLKTACGAIDGRRLLVNPEWLDTSTLTRFELVEVPKEEPLGASLLRVGSKVLIEAEHPRTAERISKLGCHVETIDLSEFAKAEGCVTCLSILFEAECLGDCRRALALKADESQ